MGNTRAQGDAFRDSVFELLRMQPGIGRIEREYPIDHQAVDIYYEERTSIGIAKVACECKDYGRPLTRVQLEQIWAKYAPLLLNRSVGAIRVITPRPVAVDAHRYAESTGLYITTRDELESRIMDFGAYLVSMKAQYTEGGLDRYYRRARLATGEDAETQLREWIVGTDCRPRAIIANYGMGKTSLARRLAAVQAERHLADSRERIPILIALADISTEQDMRGLISKHLAAQNVVHNFHYELFRELNRRGRFVIVLDGFDEMKQTMSLHDIRFNFSQINSLVEGDSRVLLLGRPTIFKDETERNYALHGIRPESQVRVSGFPDYVDKELREFDAPGAIEMMQVYGEYSLEQANRTSSAKVSRELFAERLAHIQRDPELTLLSRRPVQAKMLADLALDPGVEWRSFTRFELYQEFVTGLLERESLKRARTHVAPERRALFQREVAWWMWRTDRAGGFEVRAVPRTLYEDLIAHREDADGVLRGLLTGSLLDSKGQERFYFPHRSYLEFLVAQHICLLEGTARDLRRVSAALTPELLEFIKENPRPERVRGWFAVLNSIEGPVSDLFLSALAHVLPDAASVPQPSSVREVFVHYLRITMQAGTPEANMAFIASWFDQIPNPRARIAALLCMLELAAQSERQSALPSVFAALLLESQPEMERILASRHRRGSAVVDPEAIAMRLASRSMKKTSLAGEEFRIALDCSVFAREAEELFSSEVSRRTGPLPGEAVEMTLKDLAQLEPSLSLRKKGSCVVEFFRQFPDPSLLVPVRAAKARDLLQPAGSEPKQGRLSLRRE